LRTATPKRKRKVYNSTPPLKIFAGTNDKKNKAKTKLKKQLPKIYEYREKYKN
jgi:hypothetical protein